MTLKIELKLSGRSGSLEYSEGEEHLSIYVEMSGSNANDLLAEIAAEPCWSSGGPISPADKARVVTEIDGWARSNDLAIQWN